MLCLFYPNGNNQHVTILFKKFHVTVQILSLAKAIAGIHLNRYYFVEIQRASKMKTKMNKLMLHERNALYFFVVATN